MRGWNKGKQIVHLLGLQKVQPQFVNDKMPPDAVAQLTTFGDTVITVSSSVSLIFLLLLLNSVFFPYSLILPAQQRMLCANILSRHKLQPLGIRNCKLLPYRRKEHYP
jgi:hypothetical protein